MPILIQKGFTMRRTRSSYDANTQVGPFTIKSLQKIVFTFCKNYHDYFLIKNHPINGDGVDAYREHVKGNRPRHNHRYCFGFPVGNCKNPYHVNVNISALGVGRGYRVHYNEDTEIKIRCTVVYKNFNKEVKDSPFYTKDEVKLVFLSTKKSFNLTSIFEAIDVGRKSLAVEAAKKEQEEKVTEIDKMQMEAEWLADFPSKETHPKISYDVTFNSYTDENYPVKNLQVEMNSGRSSDSMSFAITENIKKKIFILKDLTLSFSNGYDYDGSKSPKFSDPAVAKLILSECKDFFLTLSNKIKETQNAKE